MVSLEDMELQDQPDLVENVVHRGKEGATGLQSGGATYIRWGKSSCPAVPGTEMVYSGIAAASHDTETGGGSNYFCMPKDPEYKSDLTYRSGVERHSNLYRVEYEDPLQGHDDFNIPCAICHVSTRSALIKLPAKFSCPPTWTREYYGYLMSENRRNKRTMFECVDKDMEPLPGSHADTNGSFVYHVEADCNGLPCGPYNNKNNLTV